MSVPSPGLGVDLHNVIGLKAAASPDNTDTHRSPTAAPSACSDLQRFSNLEAHVNKQC